MTLISVRVILITTSITPWGWVSPLSRIQYATPALFFQGKEMGIFFKDNTELESQGPITKIKALQDSTFVVSLIIAFFFVSCWAASYFVGRSAGTNEALLEWSTGLEACAMCMAFLLLFLCTSYFLRGWQLKRLEEEMENQ